MTDYAAVLDRFYPNMEWEGGADTDYSSLVWVAGTPTSIPPQATLDADAAYLPIAEIKDEHILVRNETGSTLSKGTAVYLSGVDATWGQDLVAAARADDVNKVPVVGLMAEDLLNNQTGRALLMKEVEDYDTQTPGWSKNEVLWLDATGGLSTTRPDSTSNYGQQVGFVKKVGTSDGEISVCLGTLIPPAPSGQQWVESQVVDASFSTSWTPSAVPTKSNGVEVASVTITPRETVSKIAVSLGMSGDATVDNITTVVSIWRGDTRISTLGWNLYKKNFFQPFFQTVLDSPNTTSAVTYYAYVHADGGSVHVNRNDAGDDAGGALDEGSKFSVMEFLMDL